MNSLRWLPNFWDWMDPGNMSQNGKKQKTQKQQGWNRKRKGFLFWTPVEGPVGWGIQVKMSSRQWETQAWNSEESSGQNKERIWELSEYKRPLESRVQMRLPEQVMEWEGTRNKSYPFACLPPDHHQDRSFSEQGLGHYEEWGTKKGVQTAVCKDPVQTPFRKALLGLLCFPGEDTGKAMWGGRWKGRLTCSNIPPGESTQESGVTTKWSVLTV